MGSVPNVGLMAQKQKSTDHMTRRSKWLQTASFVLQILKEMF
jgi:monomeric isocitrate dehydrogenase